MGNSIAGPYDTFAGAVYEDLNGDGKRGCFDPLFKDFTVKVVACEHNPDSKLLSVTAQDIQSLQQQEEEAEEIDDIGDISYYTIIEHVGYNGAVFVLDLATISQGWGFLIPFGSIDSVKIELFIPMEYDASGHFPDGLPELTFDYCDDKIGLCKYSTDCFDVDDLTKNNGSGVSDKDRKPQSFGFPVQKNTGKGRCKAYRTRSGHSRFTDYRDNAYKSIFHNGYDGNDGGGW